MSAEDRVDAGNHARKLQVDVHPVVGQQDDGIGSLVLAHRVDKALQFAGADTEGPVRDEPRRIGNRRIGKRLADDGDRLTTCIAHRVGREHVARVFVECLGTGEQRVVGEPDILRHEVAGELVDVPQHFGVLVGELPVAGHHVDAETIAGPHHVASAGPVRGPGSLPGVTAIEQQAVLRPRLVAQTLDQRLQVRESADRSIAARRVHEVEMRDGMCKPAARLDARMLEQRLADEVRRPVPRIAEAHVDAGLAIVDRQQLGVTIGKMQQARLAECFGCVDVCLRRAAAGRAAGRTGCDAGDRQQPQEFSPVHCSPFAVT